MNVEDTRLGVAEYVIDKLGVETIELKWGQGAKCIGGEIKVSAIERALELKKRGLHRDPRSRGPGKPGRIQDKAPSRSSNATHAWASWIRRAS